jgi:molybdopterin-guanine dinucleotide biosynthesis protein A
MGSSTLIVLAGGLASRLGSDKALHPVAGKPMIRHIVDGLSGLADEILVVIARNAPEASYSKILPDSTRLIRDDREGKTPLIGVVTGLRSSNSQYAIILSCDVPFVNRRVIQLLLQRASNADAVIPRWNSGRLEPLEAVYRREPMLYVAEEALAEGYLAPKDAIRKLIRVAYISVDEEIRKIDPELRTFFNVNTREDVSQAEMISRRGGGA